MEKKLPLLLFVIALFTAGFHANAQQVISGIIKDDGGHPLQFANVLLLKPADSSLEKGMISDANGAYSFQNIKAGKYLISASFTGMDQVYSNIFEVNSDKDFNAGTIILKNNTLQLKNVDLQQKMPMFQQKVDRMVINVKNSITSAGGTALDVLEKSPGVTVNRQNNTVAINGKNGEVVMLNGKITYMPMEAMVQMLAGISAGNIEKIELITTPPAKYDAEGNAGYINIVLINNPYAGLNGSYFVTAGYGKRELGSAGVNFNYRSAKINLFGNYSFDYNHSIQTAESFTQLSSSGMLISNNSFSDRDATRQVHNVRMGLDYQPDSSNIIGFLVSGYNNEWRMTAHNGSFVMNNKVLDTIITTVNKELNHWQNLMGNVNFQHTFQPGKVLYFDANYIYYKDNNPNTYANSYFKGSNEYLFTNELKSGKITPINLKVFSSDYTTAIGTKTTMETGAKVSFSKFTNDVSVQNFQQGTWVTDESLSADYLLKEKVYAVYTSFTINPGAKTSLKAGLRYEYTQSNLGTVKTANIVDRKYGELFPTFYISQKLNEKNSINFSYSRRITRPSFNDLAPFTIFFNPKTFYTGNPALQPAIANAVQASFVHKNYIFSLSYTYEKNSIEGFQTQRIDTIHNTVYLSALNFDYEQLANASISLPFTITKWWQIQSNFNLDWHQVNTVYESSPVSLDVFNYNFNITQRFSFPKDFSLELTGFYSSAGVYGTSTFEPVYQVDVGAQKKFKNKKDILRLAGADIFNTGNFYKAIDKLPIKQTILRNRLNFGTVAYTITYTHNFGNNSLKGKRDRATGAEEELKRVHN